MSGESEVKLLMCVGVVLVVDARCGACYWSVAPAVLLARFLGEALGDALPKDGKVEAFKVFYVSPLMGISPQRDQ